MDKQHWYDRLRGAEEQYGFTEGFGLVYAPWAALATSQVVFLSLNPGVMPHGKEPRDISDERGNTYEVEEFTTRSRITSQFLKMAEFMGLKPMDILPGVVAPFRSPTWSGWTAQQRNVAFELGKEFWGPVLRQPHVDTVIAVSDLACRAALDILGARANLDVPSGWGTARLRRYVDRDGRRIIHLPHLSRYQLFGKASCVEPLQRAFSEDNVLISTEK